MQHFNRLDARPQVIKQILNTVRCFHVLDSFAGIECTSFRSLQEFTSPSLRSHSCIGHKETNPPLILSEIRSVKRWNHFAPPVTILPWIIARSVNGRIPQAYDRKSGSQRKMTEMHRKCCTCVRQNSSAVNPSCEAWPSKCDALRFYCKNNSQQRLSSCVPPHCDLGRNISFAMAWKSSGWWKDNVSNPQLMLDSASIWTQTTRTHARTLATLNTHHLLTRLRTRVKNCVSEAWSTLSAPSTEPRHRQKPKTTRHDTRLAIDIEDRAPQVPNRALWCVEHASPITHAPVMESCLPWSTVVLAWPIFSMGTSSLLPTNANAHAMVATSYDVNIFIFMTACWATVLKRSGASIRIVAKDRTMFSRSRGAKSTAPLKVSNRMAPYNGVCAMLNVAKASWSKRVPGNSCPDHMGWRATVLSIARVKETNDYILRTWISMTLPSTKFKTKWNWVLSTLILAQHVKCGVSRRDTLDHSKDDVARFRSVNEILDTAANARTWIEPNMTVSFPEHGNVLSTSFQPRKNQAALTDSLLSARWTTLKPNRQDEKHRDM